MPSGYTVDLYEGNDIEFSDFVMSCARGMGAFIHQRDEHIGNEPTRMLLDVSMEKRQIDSLQQEYDEFTALTLEEQEGLYEIYCEDTKRCYRESEGNRVAMRKRYADMLMKVLLWEVPEELKSLKEFMEKQLRDSIDFDTRFRQMSLATFAEWLHSKTDGVLKRIDYWEESILSEERRVREQNRYYELLMASLNS